MQEYELFYILFMELQLSMPFFFFYSLGQFPTHGGETLSSVPSKLIAQYTLQHSLHYVLARAMSATSSIPCISTWLHSFCSSLHYCDVSVLSLEMLLLCFITYYTAAASAAAIDASAAAAPQSTDYCVNG